MVHEFLEERLEHGFRGGLDCGVEDVGFAVYFVAADVEMGAEGLGAG